MNHYREAVVGLGCHSVELNCQVATSNVEIVGRKSGFGQLDLNSGSITDVVEAVFDNCVHALDQVLVLNLQLRKKRSDEGLSSICLSCS